MEIFVWGKKGCSRCKALTQRLDSKRIKHEYISGSDTELVSIGKKVGVSALPFSFIDGKFKTYQEMQEFVTNYKVVE